MAYQESRILEARSEEVLNWTYMAIEARAGARPKASPEGADLLKADSQAVLDAVREGLAEANR